MAATVVAEQVGRHWRHQSERQAINAGAADQCWVDVGDVNQVARVWEAAHAWAEVEPVEFGPYHQPRTHCLRDRRRRPPPGAGRLHDITSCVDVDPTTAIRTRRTLLAEARDTDQLLLDTHFPAPGAARVHAADGSYRLLSSASD